MNEEIRRRARELGFDECRITTAVPPQSARQFQEWLASERHGEMAYLDRNAEKRIDPTKVLSEAKIIITGHQPQEEGYLVNGPHHLILASDHNQGVFLPMDLSETYDMDTLVPVAGTRLWIEKMKDMKMTYQYVEVPGGDHGSVLTTGAPDIFAFFAKHTKAAR